MLYGCGDISRLETGGLAVVGSRDADDDLIDYTRSVGRLAARSKRTLVSGGAKGIDQAAMRGAAEGGGIVCGVMADSLEKTTMTRDHRMMLIEGRLLLISPYDPNAGFNVGNAMQRNKLIYALADAALVVSSDVNKGGTWAGAAEQLDKLKFVPVFVRSTGEPSAGLDALRKKGALAWPNPDDAESFEAVFSAMPLVPAASAQTAITLFTQNGSADGELAAPQGSTTVAHESEAPEVGGYEQQRALTGELPIAAPSVAATQAMDSSPAEALFAVVRESIQRLATVPVGYAGVASALKVSNQQAKIWLQRLVDEGILQEQKKPSGYVVKQKGLFE